MDWPLNVPVVPDRKRGLGWRASLWQLVWAVGLSSCGSSTQPAESPGQIGEVTRRDTTIVHEPCPIDGDGASRGDANADGAPDVISVSESGKLVCQWLDLNFDKVVDVWVYYDAAGSVRRREADFDRDGRVDEIETSKGGRVVARERATTLAGRLDTWLFFEAGVLKRGERDANGDGVIDQWWEYPRAAEPECALVHSDTDGDGHPDPGATVDICGTEGSPLKKRSPAAAEEEDLGEAPITESTEPVAPGSAPAPVPGEPGPANSGADEGKAP